MSEMTVAEQAIIDVQRGLDAMARRAQQFGTPIPASDDVISDYDRRRFGRAVRFEFDVCAPIATLKSELNMVRAQITNCIAMLERSGNANERRKMVHLLLTEVRVELKYQREERNKQDLRLSE